MLDRRSCIWKMGSDLNVLPQVEKSQSPSLTGLEVLTLRAFSDCMCLWGPCQAERKEPAILLQHLLNPSISLILLDGSITVTLTGHVRNWDQMCAVAAMFDRCQWSESRNANRNEYQKSCYATFLLKQKPMRHSSLKWNIMLVDWSWR